MPERRNIGNQDLFPFSKHQKLSFLNLASSGWAPEVYVDTLAYFNSNQSYPTPALVGFYQGLGLANYRGFPLIILSCSGHLERRAGFEFAGSVILVKVISGLAISRLQILVRLFV